MRLYLSSYHLGGSADLLRDMVGRRARAVVVTNAHDLWPATFDAALAREIADLVAIGIDATQLDLREYFGRSEALAERLGEVSLVWVKGGNTFVLRRAMRASGFDDVMRPLLADDRIVYGGYSAGAVAATPTLHGIELCDDPDVVPAGYPDLVEWDGLGLVPYSIVPHWRSDHPESPLMEAVVTYMTNHAMPFRALRDGEVIVVTEPLTTS